MLSQALITASFKNQLPNQDDIDTTEHPVTTLAFKLDRANDDKAMHDLCSSFYMNKEEKEIIFNIRQFINTDAAELLLLANERTQFPFRLFDYLQRTCPCIFESPMFINALDKFLASSTTKTAEKILVATKIKYPRLSNELGIEFLLEDFPSLVFMDEGRFKQLYDATTFAESLVKLIGQYDSNPVKPVILNGHVCPTWESLATHFDLDHMLATFPDNSPKFTPKATIIGKLDIFHDVGDASGIGIETSYYGEGTIILECSVPYMNANLQQLISIFHALKERNAIAYKRHINEKPGDLAGASDNIDIIVYTSSVESKAKYHPMIVFKTWRGMENGLKALAHLGYINAKDLLQFYFHTMNIKRLVMEPKSCYLIKDYVEKLKPLRNLTSKSRLQLPFAKKLAPEPVRKIAERILILLGASAEEKQSQISITNKLLKQIILQVLDTSPHKADALADIRFCKVLADLNLNIPMALTRRKSAVDAKSQPRVIHIKPKTSA